MNHREFSLTVKSPIHEKSDRPGTQGKLFLGPGEILKVSEEDFKSLRSGRSVIRMTREGYAELDKGFFESEASYVMVSVTYGKKSL